MDLCNKKKICVVDGNALMHRAFHAIGAPLTSPDGTPTNAVFGFFNMFCKFVSDLKPDVTICTFDHTKATHRLELYEKYKANRPKMDDRLRVQFPVVEEILHKMDVPIVVEEGWEADDVMGTISSMCKQKGYICYLVTGDKDLNQLVSDDVFTVTTDRKNKEVIIRDPKAVKERFGVLPEQIVDYLALVGDKSDNIPGVEGIGDKGACDLLNKYGSIQGIYENLSEISGKRLESLISKKKEALLSQKLATINTHLDLDLDLSSISSFTFDDSELSETFQQFGLRSTSAIFDKMMQNLSSNSNVEYIDEKLVLPEVLDVSESRDEILNIIINSEQVGVSFVVPTKQYLRKNTETKPVLGFATKDAVFSLEVSQAKVFVEKILKNSMLVAYDAKDIIELAYPHDNSISPLLTKEELLKAKVFDVHVCANMLNSSETFKNQEEFYSQFTKSFTTDDDVIQRSMWFAHLSLKAQIAQEDKLKLEDKRVRELFYNTECRLTCVLSVIERNGCLLSDEILRELNEYCERELEKLRNKIFGIATHEFKIESPAQLSIVLFQELKIKPLKKNKSGYSTDAKVLAELASEHEICGLVIKYRELSKLKSTYIDALPNIRLSDNLVHTKFNQAATATGRLSSSDPNLQNIPVRSELGKKIREAFLPYDNEVFMSADYSQIELRLLAHLSEDKNLIDAFLSGEDFHAQTASRIFEVDIKDVTPKMRSRAKAVNFGIIYGQQAFSLSKQLNITFGEAKDMIDRYYYAHPKVREFLDSTIADATKNGYAQTIFGRKRTIPELQSQNKQLQAFGQRTAMNHPMQGSAADIIKMAMITLQSKLLEKNLKSKILIQVHDELDLSVPKDELEEVTFLVKDIMENVVKLNVALTVDVNFGANWAYAH